MDIRELVKHYVEGAQNPDVQTYGGRYLELFDRGRWMIQYMMDLGHMRRSRVLDVGCGFGWQALMISAMGENRVVANDIRESMITVIDSRIAALKGELEGGSVTTLLGDICSQNIPPGSFDAIFCNQTVEHIHDLDRFFAVAAKVIKRGGRMVIANDNNVYNIQQLAEVQEMWKKRDRSAEYIAELKRLRPIENKDIEPYAVMRERVISEANPALSAPTVATLADATAGMLDKEVLKVARAYAPGAVMPTPPKYCWSRNPTTGEYCERQLNPYELAAAIDRAGFRSRVRHAFRAMPLRLLNGINFRPLNRKLFNMRSVFVIVAERK